MHFKTSGIPSFLCLKKRRDLKKWTLRKIAGVLHLWLGLASGLVVSIIAITGCIYVFNEEITNAIRKDAQYVQAEEGGYMPLSKLWEQTKKSLPADYPLSRVTVYKEPNKSWAFSSFIYNDKAVTYFGSIVHSKTIYVNPYNGKITGVYDEKFNFLNIVKFLHWSLLLKTSYGQPIVGWSTFIFVLMLISGLILWWPKSKNAARQRFSFKWKTATTRKRKNYDLHTILGFYFWLLLLLIAFTGMVWAFSWFQTAVYAVATGTTAAPDFRSPSSTFILTNEKVALDSAIIKSRSAHPSAVAFGISPENDSLSPIDVYIQQKEGVYYVNHTMQYDQYSGRLLSAKNHSEKNWGEKIIAANYDIHVGAILGIPGKLIAFLASFLCSSLPITGFMIWRGRKRKGHNAKK